MVLCRKQPAIPFHEASAQHILRVLIIIIIIIIKKVKIIVTLSIKNTAGALYKSQIKGENRYCLWLMRSAKIY